MSKSCLADYEAQIPKLAQYEYSKESELDPDYNCIAWAAGETSRIWWPPTRPGDVVHWPSDAPREETLEAFCQAFEAIGYQRGTSDRPASEVERVAIFVSERTGKPTHAARQLKDGQWTSKLGGGIDIEHDELEAVSGNEWWWSYGSVQAMLWRERA